MLTAIQTKSQSFLHFILRNYYKVWNISILHRVLQEIKMCSKVPVSLVIVSGLYYHSKGIVLITSLFKYFEEYCILQNYILPLNMKLKIDRIKFNHVWKISRTKTGNLAHKNKLVGKRRIPLTYFMKLVWPL